MGEVGEAQETAHTFNSLQLLETLKLSPINPDENTTAMKKLTQIALLTGLAWTGAALNNVRAADDYQLGPDSMVKEGVPKGIVTHHVWDQSEFFPGTVRDYWVYVPAQYCSSSPASVMVFQDGGGYIRENGSWRAPVVFDNLIHEGSMPVTIGVFINPGVVPAPNDSSQPRYNRSFEYDGLGDAYARFLLEEILPEVGKSYNLTTDPNQRAIGGSSSGAICAFTAAWERPDAFRRVFSTIGTYVGLRGGNDYATMIRKTEPKPLRVFLQDGTNDLNIYAGDWWVANQDMASALEFAGYDHTTVWGEGGHNSRHGASILPEAMRWLWRDHQEPIRANKTKSKQPIMTQILDPESDWELVSEGHRFTEGPAVNGAGEVFFSDIPNGKIHKIGLDGQVTVFAENAPGVNGLMFGADGNLYACVNGKQQIVGYEPDGKSFIVVEEHASNDLVVLPEGGYFTDPENQKVWYVDQNLKSRVVDQGIRFPNGAITSPDQSLLYVSDTRGHFIYSFQIQANGDLAHKQKYFHLHVPDNADDSGADGMAVDDQGWLYVATRMGVQVLDQAGRVNGIIPKPQSAWLSNVVIGGKEMNTLYVTCGDKVYRRQLRTRAALSWKNIVTPPKVRL